MPFYEESDYRHIRRYNHHVKDGPLTYVAKKLGQLVVWHIVPFLEEGSSVLIRKAARFEARVKMKVRGNRLRTDEELRELKIPPPNPEWEKRFGVE